MPCMLVEMPSQDAKELQAARKALRLTQQQAADLLETSRSAYANWEAGVASPPPQAAARLAAEAAARMPIVSEYYGRPAARAEPVAAGESSVLVLGVLAPRSLAEPYWDPQTAAVYRPLPSMLVSAATVGAVVVGTTELEPRVPYGSLLVVQSDPAPPLGALIAVEDVETKRGYVKAARKARSRGQAYEAAGVGAWQANTLDPSSARLVGTVVAVVSEHDGPGPNIEWAGGRPLKA